MDRKSAKKLIKKYHQYFYLDEGIDAPEMDDKYLGTLAQAVIDSDCSNIIDDILLVVKDLQTLIINRADTAHGVDIIYINDGFNRIIGYLNHKYKG